VRRIVTGIALVAAVAFVWISTFPTKAECTASGRVVDPTERHCEAVDGFEQLQEHVWFHASEVAAGAGILAVALYIGWRLYQRRRSTGVARTA
jgi:hypothetical protein